MTLLTLHRRTLPLPTHAHEQKTTWCRIVDVVRTCVENVNVKRRRLAGRNTGGASTLFAATNNGMTGPGMMAQGMTGGVVPGMMSAGMKAPGMMAPRMMAPGMMGMVEPVMPIMTMNAFGGMVRGIGPQAGADVDFTNYGGMHSGMMNPHGMHSGVGSRPRLSSATSTPPMSEFDDCTRGLVAPQLVLAPSTEGAEKPATPVSVTMQLGQHCDRIAVTSKWLWMMGFDRIHDVEASKSSDGAAAAASFVPVCPELGNTRTWEPQAGILTSTKSPYSIVAANESWLTRCNLTLEDCAERTCAILQGEETEKERTVLLMDGIRHLGIDGRPHVISASLTNYTMHEPRRKFHNELSIWEVEHSDSEKKERYFLTLCNMLFPEALQPHLVASEKSSSSSKATATEATVSSAAGTTAVSVAAADPAPAPALAAAEQELRHAQGQRGAGAEDGAAAEAKEPAAKKMKVAASPAPRRRSSGRIAAALHDDASPLNAF